VILSRRDFSFWNEPGSLVLLSPKMTSEQPAPGHANDCALDALASRGVGGLCPRSCLGGLSKPIARRGCKADQRHHGLYGSGFRAVFHAGHKTLKRKCSGHAGLAAVAFRSTRSAPPWPSGFGDGSQPLAPKDSAHFPSASN